MSCKHLSRVRILIEALKQEKQCAILLTIYPEPVGADYLQRTGVGAREAQSDGTAVKVLRVGLVTQWLCLDSLRVHRRTLRTSVEGLRY